MDEEKCSLNLDEIFGLAKPIKVVWKSIEYELPRPEAFSPKSWAGFSALQGKIGSLQAMGEQLTDEQAEQLDQIANDCIKFLSPKLAKCELPFFAKVQVIKFYGDQIEGDAPKNPLGSPTGEASSVGSGSGTD